MMKFLVLFLVAACCAVQVVLSIEQEQWNLFVQKLEKSIEQISNQVQPEQVKNLNVLRQDIVDGHGFELEKPYTFISKYAITGALVKVMWSYLGVPGPTDYEFSLDLGEFSYNFDKHITKICSLVEQQLGPWTLVNTFITQDERKNLAHFLDSKTLDWLANIRICSEILRDFHFHSQRAYTTLSLELNNNNDEY